jgi:hypothetical protein
MAKRCEHTRVRYTTRLKGEHVDMHVDMQGFYETALEDPDFSYSETRAVLSASCRDCGVRISLGHADEPMVDVSAAMLIQDRENGIARRATHSEESGLAGTQRWYGKPGWDAGYLASAHEHHDAIMRDDGADDSDLAIDAASARLRADTAPAIAPHPDTIAAPLRSWPPNTGCDP